MTAQDPIKIEQKITSVALHQGNDSPVVVKLVHPSLFERPEVVHGSTYKLKPPDAVNALYLTINHCLVNEGTPDQKYIPIEIFISTKDSVNREWITALCLLISANFRKGGDNSFIAEEFCSIHDEAGGYFASGGRRYSSVIHEIGEVIGRHLQGLKELNSTGATTAHVAPVPKPVGKCCASCKEFTVVMLDGCPTCLTCGAGKCS